MFDKYAKGQLAVLKTQLRAAELGWVVSMPTTETRYDMLLDNGQKILRIQIKYVGSLSTSGSVHLDLRKETRGNGRIRLYSKEEIDVIIVYIPQIDKLVWLGPEKFDMVKTISLRFSPPKNQQVKKIVLVEDYLW